MTLTDDELADILSHDDDPTLAPPSFAAAVILFAGVLVVGLQARPVDTEFATAERAPPKQNWRPVDSMDELIGEWDIAAATAGDVHLGGGGAFLSFSELDGHQGFGVSSGCTFVHHRRFEFADSTLRIVPDTIPTGITLGTTCDPDPDAIRLLDAVDFEAETFVVASAGNSLRLLADNLEITATRRAENPTMTPAPVELVQGSWRLMSMSFGPGLESATQRLVVVIDEDRISVDGSCLGLLVAAEWQDDAFVGRQLNPAEPALSERLIGCGERALLTSIGNFLTHGDPIEVFVDEDSLLLRRAELELRARRLSSG